MGKHIVIVNAHWNNRGDEAALRPMIDEILMACDQCKITVIFKDNNGILKFPYGKRVEAWGAKFLPSNIMELMLSVISKGKWSRNELLRKEVKCISNCDLIIYSPGGSVICDKFWWRKQLEYLLPFLCADFYKIPMIVAAPSIGPFHNSIWKNCIRKRLLSVPQKICVREEISKKYLKKIGVCNHVISTIDTAFYDMPETEKNNNILIKDKALTDFLQKYSKVVGMTISDFSWHVKLSKNRDLALDIEDIMKMFIRELNLQEIGVILIPQLFGNENDSKYLERFRQEKTFILSEEYDTYFQQFLISKLYAVVGMRYHSNIFSAKMATPFLAIAYEDKMRGFMKAAGIRRYMLEVESISYEKLESKWKELVLGYDKYKLFLQKQHEKWKNSAGKTMKMIRDELKEERSYQ
ncbi:MAG: hypothetical protein HFG52_13855 [Lachnospiraceae bacterium]|jgi:Uncharacterized conserved protein|nr:hypothetical protein [Lachnospiraceae bacterium]